MDSTSVAGYDEHYMTEVTRILSQIESGDPSAAEKLLPLVYEELRKLASQRMAQENPGQTLQATALVHEAYIRLVGGEDARKWNGRVHFFAAAAESIRRVLIQEARRKKTLKRGGDLHRADVDVAQFASPLRPARLLEVDDALERLAEQDSQKADLVKLRYFVGMTVQEAADALGISVASAERQWVYIRAWLQCELSPSDSE